MAQSQLEAAPRHPPEPPPPRRADHDDRPRRGGSAGPIVFLLAVLVAGGGFLLFYFLQHQPMMLSQTSLRSQLDRERRDRQRYQTAARDYDSMRARLAALERDEAVLRQERDALQTEQAQTQAQLAAMQQAQQALRAGLSGELASGEAEISEQGGDLSIALHERILFRPGEAELNPRGQEVLTRVSATIAGLSDHRIRVEGHTDSNPIRPSDEAFQRFPTNWELSTARATTVVRFLEDHGVAGRRLSAAGYGPHRPIASNSNVNGRRRNRRIELVVLRTGR